MPASVVTIGSFDGVHRAHAALLARARQIAGGCGRVIAMAFDPHPASVLSTAPPRLTTWERRRRLLLQAGADEVVRLEPTEATLSLDPAGFVEHRLMPLGVSDVVEGPDFRFGRGRAGDIGVLAALGRGFGFAVHIVPTERVTLDDHTHPRVSSTLTRWLLEHGRVRDAAALLGRPHLLEGQVIRGDRIGRTIGVPTANIDPETMPPGHGVYAAVAELPDGARHLAALNIGTRPTLSGVARRVEAHLIGLRPADDGPQIQGLPEYGWRLGLHLHARMRDEMRFESIAHLREQIGRDLGRIQALLAEGMLTEARPQEILA
jgi:riboflavin kinase/FMN adenylyltransferase